MKRYRDQTLHCAIRLDAFSLSCMNSAPRGNAPSNKTFSSCRPKHPAQNN